MPFRSFDELINMAQRDPKMARSYVAKAKQAGKPVVSTDNPGYGEDEEHDYRGLALSKRLNMSSKSSGDDKLKTAVRDRLKQKFRQPDKVLSSTTEEPPVDKKKKVGYYS